MIVLVIGLLSYQGQAVTLYKNQLKNDVSTLKQLHVDLENRMIEIDFFNDSAVSEPIDVFEPRFIFDICKSGDLILAHSAYTSQDLGWTALLNASDIRNITLIKYVTGWEVFTDVEVDIYDMVAVNVYCSAAYMTGNLMFLSTSPIFGVGGDIWFLLICDVSDPKNPVVLANISMPEYEMVVRDMEVVDNVLFVLSDRYLSIFDITSPSNPVNVSRVKLTYDLEDASFELHAALKTLAIDGNYVYVVTHIGDLIILDVSDLNSPETVFSGNLHCMGYDALAVNDTLFVAGGIGGLYIFNVSDKSSPTLIAHYNDTLRCSMGLEFFDLNTLLVADNIYGLHVLDISDLHGVQELCNTTSYDRLMDLVVEDDLIIGADMLAGIHVYNATDKTNIKSIYWNPLPLIVHYDKYISVGASPNLGNWETPIGENEYLTDYIEWAFLLGASTLVSRDNKMFFKTTQLEFTFTPIIVYNDTNGDGKLSIIYEVHPDNPYLIMRKIITDQVFFATASDITHVKFSGLENETWHGHEAYRYTLEILEMNFTNSRRILGGWFDAYADEVVGNSARGNVTFTFHFIPFENTNKSSPFLYDNLTIKVDINLKLYDVNWGVIPERYCVAIGFNSRAMNDLVYYPAASLSTSRGTSIRSMDVIGDLLINEKYTAMNGNYIYNGTVNVSFDYAWEDFHSNFEMVNRHTVFANLIGIPYNTTEINYDPQLGFFTIGKRSKMTLEFNLPPSRPYTGEEEQPPPSFGSPSTMMFVVGVATVFAIVATIKFVKRRR